MLLYAAFLPGCVSPDKTDDVKIKDVLNNFKGEPVVPRDANRILVPVFSNFTDQPSISEKLTVKIREEINSDARLAVVYEYEQADLLLKGIIIGYQIQPVQFDSFDKPVKKRLKIIASVKLFDLKKDKEIFFERAIQAFEEFSDMIPPITSEIQVQEKVIADLASRITLKTVNGWYTKLMTPEEKGK